MVSRGEGWEPERKGVSVTIKGQQREAVGVRTVQCVD